MQNEIKEEKTKRTPKQKVWLGVRIAFNVIFYAIILLVLLFSISNIRAKNEKDRIPNIFGIGYLNVLSDSMEGNYEDSFKAGDMIIVKTASEDRIANLKVGDIVTFYDNNLAANTGVSTALNTHRIVYIDKEANLFYTVGDKAMKESNGFDISILTNDNCLNILQQTFGSEGFQAFGSIEIRGIYSTKWEGFGKVIQTINNHFVSIIILPIAALLLLEIAYLIYNIMKVREEKIKKNLQPEADLVMTDDDKEKLKAELRAQLLAEMGVAAPAANESSEESLEKPTKEASEETKDEAAEDTSALDNAPEEQSVEEIAPVEEVTEEAAPVEEIPVEEVQVEEPQTEEKTQNVVEKSVKEEAPAEVKEETPANEEKSDAKPKKAPAKKATTTAKKSPTSTAKKTTTTTKKASTSTTKKTSDTAAKKTTSKSTTAAKKPSTSTATKKAASPKSTTKKSTKAE